MSFTVQASSGIGATAPSRSPTRTASRSRPARARSSGASRLRTRTTWPTTTVSCCGCGAARRQLSAATRQYRSSRDSGIPTRTTDARGARARLPGAGVHRHASLVRVLVRILIAEDEPVSRRLLEQSLGRWGYEPVTCVDGGQAWDGLRRQGAPRVAILEWMMPHMDGLEVCRAARATDLALQPYLILLTGRSKPEDVIAGLKAGAADHLTKPVDRGELEARLQVASRVVALQV